MVALGSEIWPRIYLQLLPVEDGSEGNGEDRGVFQHISSCCAREQKTQNGNSQIPRQVGKINYSWLPPIAGKDLCALNFGMSWNRQFPGFRHDICYWDPSG